MKPYPRKAETVDSVIIKTYRWTSQTGCAIVMHTFTDGSNPILYNSLTGAKYIDRRDAYIKLSMARSTGRFTRQEGIPNDL